MHIPFYLLKIPSFSLGLSQDDDPAAKQTANPIRFVSPPKDQEEEVLEQRKSKRSRITSAVLQDYRCDPKVTAGLCIIPNLEQRFKVMEHSVLKES